MSYKVKFKGLDERLTRGVSYVAPQLGLEICRCRSTEVRVIKCDRLSICRDGDAVVITYIREHQLFRMLSYLPGVLAGGDAVEEHPNLNMLCYMADMSRNAVYNMPTAKRMLRYLALMGYDSMMLYTEDTFELPGYPYFGHMRGRFSHAELKEIDDYAYDLGIEVIPCVQTLAHLSTALRWPGFSFQDTGDILMVGDDRTYAFIDAIMKTCAECFRSRRINIGMDEAHMLGRGNYLLKNGYRPSSEVMLEHLDRVVKICTDNGFYPMIWSDMFFRMAFNGAYRVREGEIAQEIIDKVPADLTLIYWDYYSLDSGIFSHMLDCHLKFHNPIVFAGGAWKWSGFAPHNTFSVASTEMQLNVCADRGVDNVIVTAWGDNGGEASQFSVLPSMLYFAERAYASSVTDEKLEERAVMSLGLGYRALLTLDAPNELPGVTVEIGHPVNPCRYLVFNDPLEGLLDVHIKPDETPAGFAAAARRLEQYVDDKNFGYMFDTLAKLCVFLADKCDVSLRTRRYYLDGDKAALADMADNIIPTMISELDDFIVAFRNQWYLENKTFGFSTQELRLGGLRERLKSAALRLADYADGRIDRIEELEQPVLSFNGKNYDADSMPYISNMNWHSCVTSGLL
ncbi:MAG: family 20 glycosylhydrolase [Eubacteriales bacterium]|nr:family 20 glycosylhydrolase [Eubacteriales bacterium]